MTTWLSAPGLLGVCPQGGPCCGGVHLADLSPREREAFFHVVAGRTIREVAAAMHVQLKTAENYRCRVLAKIRARNAAEAVHFAVQHGLLVARCGGCVEGAALGSCAIGATGRHEWAPAAGLRQMQAAGRRG